MECVNIRLNFRIFFVKIEHFSNIQINYLDSCEIVLDYFSEFVGESLGFWLKRLASLESNPKQEKSEPFSYLTEVWLSTFEFISNRNVNNLFCINLRSI